MNKLICKLLIVFFLLSLPISNLFAKVLPLEDLIAIALEGGSLSDNKDWQDSKEYDRTLVLDAMAITKMTLASQDAEIGRDLLPSVYASDVEKSLVYLKSALKHFDEGKAWSENNEIFKPIIRSLLLSDIGIVENKLESISIINNYEIITDKKCHINVTNDKIETIQCTLTEQIPRAISENSGPIEVVTFGLEVGYYLSPVGVGDYCISTQDLDCIFRGKTPKAVTAQFHGVSQKYISNDLKLIYPSNDGFLNGFSYKKLSKNYIISRYGNPEGKYFSPKGTHFQYRSLPNSQKSIYTEYTVLKPFNVKSGNAAPWFDQPGGGIQYKILDEHSFKYLIENGFIKKL